jgi:hypothetical protein
MKLGPHSLRAWGAADRYDSRAVFLPLELTSAAMTYSPLNKLVQALRIAVTGQAESLISGPLNSAGNVENGQKRKHASH